VAATEYTLADGTKACGVTTVLDEWKETLFGWKSPEIERAADIGHQLHGLIHRANCGTGAKGVKLHPETMLEVATGMASWMMWCAARNPRVIGSEIQLISEKWRIGGTMDAKMWIDGDLWAIDWKPMSLRTSARLQLTAYSEMDREVNPTSATDNLMLVGLSRSPKDGPGFVERRWEKNPADVQIFQSIVDLRSAREGLRARHKAALRRDSKG